MTRNTDIVCVEWNGPHPVRFDYGRSGADGLPTIYKIVDADGVAYIGCTKRAVACRMAAHTMSRTPMGLFMRGIRDGAVAASLWTLEGADHRLEAALIRDASPRFNTKHVIGRDSVVGTASAVVKRARNRAIAWRLRVEGLSWPEIGKRIGMTGGGVQALVRRAY